MRKFLVWFLTLPVLFISFVQLSAFSKLEKHEVKNEIVRQKRNTNFKINEEDFINTMFLRSSFFENWSDTNYFINPTLKTSKTLTYNENWYLDFLKDSYQTGVVFDKPSDKFLQLYYNWDNYVNQYKLYRFYNVDKKFFLKDLTNFMYTYFKRYDSGGHWYRFEKSIKNLEQVKFNQDNWKLIDINSSDWISSKEFNNNKNKWYIMFAKKEDTNNFNFISFKNNDINKLWSLGNKGSFNISLKNEWYWFNWLYRWDGVGEPTIPTINKDTDEITDWKSDNERNFLIDIIDEVVKENIRVEQGGSANYEKLDQDGTQKIIFDFEIIDELDKERIKKVVYRMILTINKDQIIRAGNISLIHYINDEFEEEQLNFRFDFTQSALNDENYNPLWDFKIDNFIYREKNKIIYEQLESLIYINVFLKQFFSSVLIPMFTNRGAFMEANYLDFLTYDTVVVNFLGLQPDNFLSVVKLYNVISNKFQNDKNKEIDFKMKWNNILNSSFKIMNNFYKNYLRAMFDLENDTYLKGYNKKFGLLISNGFKIFPKYFYFSDKYHQLDVKLYSSHANKFYQTKYGKVFNFDYSVFNDFKVNDGFSYLFDDKSKYSLQVKEVLEQKVGYGVFELQAIQKDEFYYYYDFNFGIYNWKDLTSLVGKPTGQWWDTPSENCKWYDMVCHLKNGAIWIVNNIPGVKQANELASGVGKLFQTTYNFFAQIFEIWKFNLDFYIVITNTFLLIIFMKFIRMF